MWKLLKWLLALGLVAAVAVGAAAAWMWRFAHAPLAVSPSPAEFTIPAGSSLRGAVAAMNRAGVGLPELPFRVLARALEKDADIKAGTYEVTAGITPLALLDKLSRGDFALADIQFIEGWTFQQMRSALDAHAQIRHDTTGLPDAEIMRLIGGAPGSPEGRFFPDTYRFPRRSSDLDVLKAAYGAMEKRLSAAWAERDPGLPLKDPYEALILASIVEKETGRSADRALIAGVFVNRLRIGMRLQTDPTVIYGLGDKFDGNLRKRDLTTDSPYNTYTREGLPPTPIAMPGLASIQAATRPAKTDALYFVARGDGTSEFSRNLDDHNRAVRKYQLGVR
jgi:UPF0755 protein